jgi:hypothetical protein
LNMEILLVITSVLVLILLMTLVPMASNLIIIVKELKGLRHQIQETFTPDIFGDGGFSGHPKSTVESLDTLVLEIRGIHSEIRGIHEKIIELNYEKLK